MFLLLGVLVLLGDTLQQGLESANHVSEEADADHLNDHLEYVLILVGTGDVSIPHRGEGGDNPVQRSDVNRPEVDVLQVTFLGRQDPPIFIIDVTNQADQNPEVGQEMGYKGNLDDQSDGLDQLFDLLDVEAVGGDLGDELIDEALIQPEFGKLDEPQEDETRPNDGVGNHGNAVEQELPGKVVLRDFKWVLIIRDVSNFNLEEVEKDVHDLDEDDENKHVFVVEEVLLLPLQESVVANDEGSGEEVDVQGEADHEVEVLQLLVVRLNQEPPHPLAAPGLEVVDFVFVVLVLVVDDVHVFIWLLLLLLYVLNVFVSLRIRVVVFVFVWKAVVIMVFVVFIVVRVSVTAQTLV